MNMMMLRQQQSLLWRKNGIAALNICVKVGFGTTLGMSLLTTTVCILLSDCPVSDLDFCFKADDRIEAPKADHTFKNSKGHYLLWDPAKSQSNPNTSVFSNITSTPLSIERHCLSFWYFDDSEMEYELDIISSLAEHPVVRSIKPGFVGFSWKVVQVDFFPFKYLNSMH